MADRPGKRPESREPATEPQQQDVATPDASADTAHGSYVAGDRVDIGPLSLVVPQQWQFHPLEDRVVGRHASKVGVLQIKVLPPGAAPSDPTHEMLMAVARDMSGYELEGPGSDKAKERIDSFLAGGESFRSGRDFVRVWYHQRPEGLAVASFSCKAKRVSERSVVQLIRQCDRIIASIRLPQQAHA